MEALFGFSPIRDLISESGPEIGERVERLNIRENLRKLERRVIAQSGPGLVASLANFAYFDS
jgi:hypothetical protein